MGFCRFLVVRSLSPEEEVVLLVLRWPSQVSTIQYAQRRIEGFWLILFLLALI